MRVWTASWRGWPLAALVVAAGCLVAAGNWWSTWRAFVGDPGTAALADHAGHRSLLYVGWAVVALGVAVVLRAVREQRLGRLDPAPPEGAP
ncbi:hypothetical protein ACFT5B_08880 [Luteimicrobium sp. NPDC057192]|uniref:hypothetical protein n=1 Tax=Luteimicrobium sp. NPDC057192 TaxID=3346042 RepID=UPI00362D6E2D